MEKVAVTGKELSDENHNLRLNVNGKSAPVSLAQFHQVLVDHLLLLLELQLLPYFFFLFSFLKRISEW